MTRRSPLPLSRILAIQMTLVAVGVSLVLLVFYAAHYMLDTQALRRMTLEADVHDIVAALRSGEDPAKWAIYDRFPQAYGFRVFDSKLAGSRKVVVEANAVLIPAPEVGSKNPNLDPGHDLVTGFQTIGGNGNQAEEDGWLLTERDDVGEHVYWIQTVMVGDPAWRWTRVIKTELLDHVVVPVVFIVPALTLAVFFTTRRALRPLNRVAEQAGALGRTVLSGEAFTPLEDEKLPVEFRRVVAAINAMLGRLEQSLTLQKQFTSDVAHELRTPLAVLLLETSQLPPGPVTDRLKRELGELGDLVNQLLRFAQAEDAMARQRQTVDIAAAARKVCEDLAGVAFGHEKSIEFDAPDAPILVSGHPVLIDAAIRNVVDNAVKYAPPRSTISVSVDGKRNVIVDDRGPGIADGQKKVIFERYWRADRRRKEGVGIGLALVRRIALLHGGDVRVEDRPGGGARFVLSLGAAASA
ncbi:MAG: ATP-binding protein [Acidobacteriota bacterium]